MKKLKNGNMVNMKKRQNWTQFITIEKRVYSKLSKIESCKKNESLQKLEKTESSKNLETVHRKRTIDFDYSFPYRIVNRDSYL